MHDKSRSLAIPVCPRRRRAPRLRLRVVRCTGGADADIALRSGQLAAALRRPDRSRRALGRSGRQRLRSRPVRRGRHGGGPLVQRDGGRRGAASSWRGLPPTPEPRVGFTPISAGENVIFSGDAGTVLTVARSDVPVPTYGGVRGGRVVEGLPPDLVLDVPGDLFPTARDVTLPSTPPPFVSLFFESSEGAPTRAITVDTVFGWRPSGIPGVRLSFEIAAPPAARRPRLHGRGRRGVLVLPDGSGENRGVGEPGGVRGRERSRLRPVRERVDPP